MLITYVDCHHRRLFKYVGYFGFENIDLVGLSVHWFDQHIFDLRLTNSHQNMLDSIVGILGAMVFNVEELGFERVMSTSWDIPGI